LTTWTEVFAPVAAKGREARSGQALLGQAVLDVIEKGGSLMGEAATGTGKSFATLIPIIHAIRLAKDQKKTYRGVVSTETLTLQRQLTQKDLPFLESLYPGFTFRKLMGRANYLCLPQAKLNGRGNAQTAAMVEKLKIRQSNLGDGEFGDVCRVLGRELTKEEWESLVGSSKFCADNQCDAKDCYSTAARAKAMAADLVVVNHALLVTDVEMKVNNGGGPFADGMLGQIDCLVVDEAHKLEGVMIDQWTKKINDWELSEMSASVMDGIEAGKAFVSNASIGYTVDEGLEKFTDVLNNIRKYFSAMAQNGNEEWKNNSFALCPKSHSKSDPPHILTMMTEFEEENPGRLVKVIEVLEKASKYLKAAQEPASEQKGTGLRKINKAIRACKDLTETAEIISKALQSTNGVVSQYGAYGAIVDGWERRNGEKGMTLRLVPLDVSTRAKTVWKENRTNIMVSATLTDLTDGTLKYARESVGFPEGRELKVGTPFALSDVQRVYLTSGRGDKIEGAQYSFEELVALLKVSKGRALVLFTSRVELDTAAMMLRALYNSGEFPYRVLVQEKDCDKDKLADDFKEDIHSVLLATKSFFTGFDAPGETLSMVVMCKFPLPRYSVECKMMIEHWRKRGFPNWYSRLALTDLEQAFGRLIRSTECRGILAMLDFRVINASTNVGRTAAIGLSAIGSPITYDMNAAGAFIDQAA
jgi:ATP-dependent DNA helicase DinG